MPFYNPISTEIEFYKKFVEGYIKDTIVLNTNVPAYSYIIAVNSIEIQLNGVVEVQGYLELQ